MRPEDRQAIDRLHRTVKPRDIKTELNPTDMDRVQSVARNILATFADELRTEGHIHTRRPLVSPHE